jgi:ABC-type branched-subunit amino acid transport system ATPase component
VFDPQRWTFNELGEFLYQQLLTDARTFQAVRLFKGLSVSENLEVSLVANGLSRIRARERAKDQRPRAWQVSDS